MRKDLGMRKGKMIAQGAHASMKVFFDIMRQSKVILDGGDIQEAYSLFPVTSEMEEWINGPFTKIVVYVQSEKQLMDIYKQAKEADLPCSLIVDAGKTEFSGKPTKTCCAIGPANNTDIDKITSNLPLL